MSYHDGIVALNTADAIGWSEVHDDDGGKVLEDLCVQGGSASNVTSCYLTNILSAWDYSESALSADDAITTTLNDVYTATELEAFLGKTSSTNGSVTSAKSVKLVYYLKDDLETINNDLVSNTNDYFEAEFLKFTIRTFKSSNIVLSPFATRSWSDEFGAAITGDILLRATIFLENVRNTRLLD